MLGGKSVHGLKPHFSFNNHIEELVKYLNIHDLSDSMKYSSFTNEKPHIFLLLSIHKSKVKRSQLKECKILCIKNYYVHDYEHQKDSKKILIQILKRWMFHPLNYLTLFMYPVDTYHTLSRLDRRKRSIHRIQLQLCFDNEIQQDSSGTVS